jgi:3-dehydroquinate dehydratase/shikimate dehydrogenase
MNNLPTFNQPLQSIGAVSSRQKVGKGKLFGYNTDYVGAISAIEDGLRGI